MKTKQQALDEAGEVFADVLAIVSGLTPREAAERAWHSGGPSVDELERQIRQSEMIACSSRAGFNMDTPYRPPTHRPDRRRPAQRCPLSARIG